MSQESTHRIGGELMSEEGPDGLITRAFLRGTGLSALTVRQRPVIGIANTWSELNPCNAGLRELAQHVKRGITAAGGLALEFPTISLAEAFTRPSSMYLRNLLAMDTEEMITASPIDGVVLLGGCDKTLPAQLMGAASAGKPALALAAGPRPLSTWEGRPMAVENLWPLIDQRRTGHLSDSDWSRLEGCLSGGVGTCNVMGTAVTMAVVAEVLGMALPGTALLPAGSAQRAAAAEHTGRAIVARARAHITPAAVMTPSAFDNALRAVCAVGGSTNAVIHLQAIAGRLGLFLTPAHLQKLSDSTPLLADVKPSGRRFLHDFEADGGVPALMGRLREIADMTAMSGDDRSWDETATDPASIAGCLSTLTHPVGQARSLVMLRGSLAPDGALLKQSAADPGLCKHVGRAVVFDGVDDLRARIDHPDLKVDATSVLVLRGTGPIGGPGMPEVGHLPIPRKLLEQGVTDMVRISDARMSGTATGTVVLHVAPEAAAGGPLALVHDGDLIELDTARNTLDLLVDSAELERRSLESGPNHQGPQRNDGTDSSAAPQARGYARLFAEHVTQADRGCDFDFLQAAR
ncbi:dihydroxy-acid dehydratase [Nocardia sp. NPDC004123]